VDELAHGRDAVDENVDDIRTSRGNGLVRRHGDGDALGGGTGLEASGVEEGHTVAHVDRVGDETTVVERDLDLLCVCGSSELDGEGRSDLEVLAGELDVGRTGRVALEVRRSVDLVAELGDVGVLCVGLEDGLLDGVGAGNEQGTVEEEESNTVVETGNGGLGAGGEALALGLVGVVQEDLKSRVAGNTETLGTLLSTVDPDDSTVGKKSTLNHTTAFGHRVHLPRWVGIKRPDAAAGGVTRSSNVLVRATTADDNVGVPVVLAGQRKHDGSTSVGVGTVGTGEVRQHADNGSSLDLEDLGRLGDLDKDVAILHQVHEGVHVVGLVLAENLHVVALATRSTVGVQDLVSRVVVLGLAGVETVLGAGCNKDGVIGHDLSGSIPARSVELSARLNPSLAVLGCVGGRALEEANALETIANGRVNEVKRSVTTKRNKAAVSHEDTARAEGVGLVGKGNEVAGDGVPLRRVSVLAVGKLELGVVLDLVKEDNTTVGHETSVHSRDTGSALESNGSRLGSSRCRAGTRGGDSRSLVARTALAALTTVRSGVTTVAVHAAAAALGPVTANRVAELGTTASVRGGDTIGVAGGGWLSEDRLARCASGGRTGVGDGRGSGSGSIAVLAAVLAAVGLETVTVSGTAVSVLGAAATVSALGIASCAVKVLSTAAIIPDARLGRSGVSRSGDGVFVAARLAALAAVGWGVSTPAVLRAAGAGVDCALGVAEQVAVLGTAFAILRVLCVLTLDRSIEHA
jgi:hypothetical protein